MLLTEIITADCDAKMRENRPVTHERGECDTVGGHEVFLFLTAFVTFHMTLVTIHNMQSSMCC
jgi:hypothetical protein